MRWRVVIAGCVAALTLPAVGSAAPPRGEIEHNRSVETFLEENFCGTGESVTVTIRSVETVLVGESGGDPEQRLRGSFNFRATFTFGDRSATYQEAGRFTNEIISGVESGVHTHRFTEIGLRGAIRSAPGGRIVRDAGRITFEVTFDENGEPIGDPNVLEIKGPHELFFAGDFFCPAVTEALGIG